MEQKHYFKKIKSEDLMTYLLTFFNLSDIRTLFLLSKQFINILNKDNKKIIREIQEKVFGSESSYQLLVKELKISKYTVSNYLLNKSPILSSILADNYLVCSSNKFDNGFMIYDLNNNKIHQKILFDDNSPYSYVSSFLYIKGKKILLVGTNNGYIIGYYLNLKHFDVFWEYKTGINKEIKRIIYFEINNNFVILSLDSDDLININFIRIFHVNENENINNTISKYIINYMKSYIIKNYILYNIKYFEGEHQNFLVVSSKDDSFHEDINNSFNTTFKFDKICKNYLSIISIDKFNIDFENELNNKEYILNNDTYEELTFDYTLTGHKSFISDFLYLKQKNSLISVEYLSPYLFIWDLTSKLKANIILFPHTDSILTLLNISYKFISSAGRDRKIFLYKINDIFSYKETDSNKVLNNYEIKCNHSSDIYKLNYYKDSHGCEKIISSSFDKTIKIFKMSSNFDKILSKVILTGHSASISCVKLDLLRKQIITIDIDSVINIWEYKSEEHLFVIKNSIELNIVNRKKEYIDDIILLYDNLNCIIKIDRTKNIKVFCLSKETFLYEYTEQKDKILKIIDCCNFANFICYSSNNIIKIYIYKIQKIDNLNYDYKIKNIKEIPIDNINFKESKMTCFDLVTWKHKIIGIGLNTGKIVIMRIYKNKNSNSTSNQYIIDVNSHINNNNKNSISKNSINQIKCIDFTSDSIYSNINSQDCNLYIIFSMNNIFFIYSLIQKNNESEMTINFISKIENKKDIIFFEILNGNLLIVSFVNCSELELIYLPSYIKDSKNFLIIDDEPIINLIDFPGEYINKILYTKNKKGIFCISNNSIKYLLFNKKK